MCDDANTCARGRTYEYFACLPVFVVLLQDLDPDRRANMERLIYFDIMSFRWILGYRSQGHVPNHQVLMIREDTEFGKYPAWFGSTNYASTCMRCVFLREISSMDSVLSRSIGLVHAGSLCGSLLHPYPRAHLDMDMGIISPVSAWAMAGWRPFSENAGGGNLGNFAK